MSTLILHTRYVLEVLINKYILHTRYVLEVLINKYILHTRYVSILYQNVSDKS